MSYFSKVKVFYKDKLNFWLLNLAGLLVLSTWFLFLFKPIKTSSLAILHYNIYFGFDILGNWSWLFFIPGLVSLFSLLDLYLAIYLWNKQAIWSQFLLLLILLINLMSFVFLFNILNYNL
ncbi:hypothetical protein H6761_01085 [Candidatus Nomurabacteria bacterium]|nr:hypothetical protein [Candidatus Nomurabacteria bacterium]